MSDPSPALPRILLVEPQFVLRRTIVEVARSLGVARMEEVTSLAAAVPLLAARSFDGIVLDVGTGDAAFSLLTRLRAGAFASPAGVPVLASIVRADADLDVRLQALDVYAALRKPFKIGELLSAIERMTRGRH